MSPNPSLSDKDVAARLGCHKATVWRWVSKGIVPEPVRIGGISRWTEQDVQGVIDRAIEDRNLASKT